MEEDKKFDGRDMDTVRFFSLVSMFATSAYQSMGKIANPMTGKVERNLESAQGMIDILIMLKNKTKGNLTEEETKILASSITDLQLNFVKEKDKPEPEKKEEPKEEAKEEKKKEEEKGGEKKEEPKEEVKGEEKEEPKEETKEEKKKEKTPEKDAGGEDKISEEKKG